ncbi:asparaginase [Candidatus Kaiserbacteria bacterium]|nr:asparaginase [Candidatus Kaiserbacteria bacterium]
MVSYKIQLTEVAVKTYILNTGGTLGMVGKPLRPAKSAKELLEGINVPSGIEITLEDFPLRQDSTNVMHKDRVQMGELIATVYDEHDAFVVLHGTDSLAETCAFFSMLFKLSLQKPLFVIGAQMSKDESGTDVPMQIANTLRVADAFIHNNVVGVYSVCIGDVLHGARVRKRRDSDFSAFYTPGIYPVAQAWPHVLIQEWARKKDGVLEVQGLRLDSQFEQQVAIIIVSADSPPYILMDMVKAGKIRGVVLECKGAGNVPDRVWDFADEGSYSWIDAIRAATQKGIHVGILSPFEDGRVELERYELGQKAKEAGAISLESLTPAMGDVKLRQAIAMHPEHPDRIQRFISTNILGELLPGFVNER